MSKEHLNYLKPKKKKIKLFRTENNKKCPHKSGIQVTYFCIFPLTFGHYLTNVVALSSSERNKLFLLSVAHQGIEHLRPAL